MPDSPTTSVDDLAALLEVPRDDVAFLDRLDPADRARLHDLVTGTLAREAEAIDRALGATLRFLPGPLRGRARTTLFPGE